jgi:hypothetical protein
MIAFNKQGNLEGDKIQKIELNDFETQFITNFNKSTTRAIIFIEFKKLISEIKKVLNTEFYILIDGSFVSNKENPNDIDFIFVIPNEHLEDQIILDQIKVKFYHFKKKKNRILDFYIIPSCTLKSSDEIKEKTIKILEYWVNLFSKTRMDDFGVQHNKGIIKLIL